MGNDSKHLHPPLAENKNESRKTSSSSSWKSSPNKAKKKGTELRTTYRLGSPDALSETGETTWLIIA